MVGKCFDDEFPWSLVCHCSALYRDTIICVAFIMKRERETFARATVFILEHQLFHLCNKNKKKYEKKKVNQKRDPEERWPALVALTFPK